MINAAPIYKFHLLAKPSGAICNLDCKYCFFLSKEELYPDSDFRMKDHVHEQYIKQLLQAHGHGEVTIAWQGGEPTLMGLDFFNRSLEWIEKYKKPGQQIIHTIQTNATRLNDDWAQFFADNHFLVGVSMDGPQALHDEYRVYKSGKGSFNGVMRGYELLKKYQVDINILCTLHAANANYPLEIYHFFRDQLQANYLQFIPIIERVNEIELPLTSQGWNKKNNLSRPLYKQQGHKTTSRSITAEQYGNFLVTLFDEWIKNDVGKIFVQMFDVALASWMGMHSLCVFSPTCGNSLALEHNGDLYSCDHYVEPDYLLGNIMHDNMGALVASEKQRQFGRDKYDSLPQYCHDCNVKRACYGGCPKDRFIQTPSGEAGLNYLCAGYKHFFNHINEPMQIMARLLRTNRSPAEIMQWYQQKQSSEANHVTS